VKSKGGYVVVLSILLVFVSSIVAIAIFSQVEATTRKVSLTIQKMENQSDALKILATAAAYLRSRYSVANGFYLADHPQSQEFDAAKEFIISSSGPVEKTIWQSFFQGDAEEITFTVAKNLLLTGSTDSDLKKALNKSKERGLINADLSKVKVLAFSESNERSWSVLLYVNVDSSWCWALTGPEGFFNYAVFLPNGIPSYAYYSTGEVIDGPSWFGVDDNGKGGLGIGGNPGPRFYGKTFYRLLRKYSNLNEENIFIGGRVVLSDEDVAAFKNAYQGKTYWEAQMAAIDKVDIIDLVTGQLQAPENPAGLILTYSKDPGNQPEDLIMTSTIQKINGEDTQVVKFYGYDGKFRSDNSNYEVELLIPYPGPPNVPVTIVATETKPNGDTNVYTANLPSFNGFLGLFCDTTNSSIALGEKNKWIKNVFMGDWTVLVMGNKGRQQEQTPWDVVNIYSDVEYYSARDDSTMIVETSNASYTVYMNPFFYDGTPIPNQRNVVGRLKLTDGSPTSELVDGKSFWDAWYKKLSQTSTRDHLNFITTGDISTPWHDGYKISSSKIRNIRLDMSVFTMYWDRTRKPGHGNNVLIPTLEVDYRNFKGLGYRVVFGSIASEAVTATWDGSKGLKEFNIFDNRLYSARRGFSPMTGAILLEGLRLR
jgi:hypothetical protein